MKYLVFDIRMYQHNKQGLYSHQILHSTCLDYLCVLDSNFEVIAKAVILVVHVAMYLWNHLIEVDYNAPETQAVFFAGYKSDTIPINTINDSIAEVNEFFFVIAVLPGQRGSCTARVTIVDKSKLICICVHTYMCKLEKY